MIQSQPPSYSLEDYDDAQRLGMGVNVCVVWLHAMPTQNLGACGTAAACSCLRDPALALDWLPAPKYPPRLNTLSNELCRGAVRLALSCHPQWLPHRTVFLPSQGWTSHYSGNWLAKPLVCSFSLSVCVPSCVCEFSYGWSDCSSMQISYDSVHRQTTVLPYGL